MNSPPYLTGQLGGRSLTDIAQRDLIKFTLNFAFRVMKQPYGYTTLYGHVNVSPL